MLEFLFKRERTKPDAQEWQELCRKLDRLEQVLEQSVKHNQVPEVHIHIDYLNLDRPVLESLIFRLDQLDINELSGILNLGNNFGSAPDHGTKKTSTRSKKEETRSKADPQADSQFRKTAAGYSYKRKS